MLSITRFNGDKLLINPDLMKFIEEGGDTIITMLSGEKILVKETADVVKHKFISYKKEISGSLLCS